MDMFRKIEKRLEIWKNDGKRKSLLLVGVRQSGKTYILKKFGSAFFESVIYIDFESNPEVKRVFEGSLDCDNIISQLEAFTSTHFIDGKTLLILDEIQACPKAITSLKYFTDSTRDIHVVGAGSLLGVALKRSDFSFPVGKVFIDQLYPMDFEEFLIASGQSMLADACRDAFFNKTHLALFLHEQLLESYRNYLVVGGMPDVVSEYLSSNSFLSASSRQTNILAGYKSDIAKYADNSQKVYAQRAYDTIPAQLAKDNKKFQYNLIRKGATASIFGSSLEWLSAAGVILRCKKLTAIDIPLAAYEDLSSFKMYLSDPGLLVRMANYPRESIFNNYGERFMGGLTENYVATTFAANSIPLYYWESEGKAEIDFILQLGSKIIPVEVKSNEHTKSKSLSVYKNMFSPEFSIRLSSKNMGFENGIFSIPLYAAWLINEANLKKALYEA